MTETTQTVREQAFLPLASDIPDGMTLQRYRSERARRAGRVRRRLKDLRPARNRRGSGGVSPRL